MIAIAAAAVATVVNFRKLAAIKLDRLERGLLSLRLTRHGVKAALSQGLSLTLRHWWPATVAVSTVSLRARRLLVVAGVVEAV